MVLTTARDCKVLALFTYVKQLKGFYSYLNFYSPEESSPIQCTAITPQIGSFNQNDGGCRKA